MNHRKIIDESLSQLMSLAEERDRIEHQMGKLHLAARAHLNLIEDKAEREALRVMLDNYRVRIGIADLIKLCLYLSDRPMTPVEIRNFIVNFGSEASTQPNLLQAIHTILGRFKGELVKEEVEDGEKAFRLLTIAERISKTGVDANAAKKAGKEVENKFDPASSSGWYQHMLEMLGGATNMPSPAFEVGATVGARFAAQTRPRRAVPPSSSFAAKAFAEEDAKKKK